MQLTDILEWENIEERKLNKINFFLQKKETINTRNINFKTQYNRGYRIKKRKYIKNMI